MIIRYLKRLIGYIKFGIKFSFSSKRSALILGVPMHNKIGDSAIMIAECDFLKKYAKKERIREISTCEFENYYKILKFIPCKRNTFFYKGGIWEMLGIRRNLLGN